MKRFIIAAAIAIFVFVSCAERNEGNPVFEERYITIKASGENAVTRTTRDSDGTVLWSPNEEISLFYHTGTDGGSKFTSVNETRVARTDFSGVINVISGVIEGGVVNPRYFYGIYPYNAENSVDAEGKIVTVVRDSQVGTPGTFADGHFVSIGKSRGLEMGFYNLCGGFKFRLLRDDVTKVTLKGNNGEVLGGKVKVAVGDDNVPLVDEIVDGKTELVMTCPEGAAFQTGVDYFFVILPQTLSGGLTFTMETSGGLVGERKVETSVEIIRSLFSYANDPVDTGVEYRHSSGNIVFASEDMKAVCVRNWDTDGDGELSYIEAAAVTSLGSTFSNKEWFKQMSFDELQYFTGLTTLERAFVSATGLTSVVLPKSLTSIGASAFKGCDNLTSIVIPDSVTTIDLSAFAGCSRLTSIVIPDSVTTIDQSAFSNCSNLSSIEIPDSVISIGSAAFFGCSSLTSVEIPDSVTTIGSRAFYGCSGITSVVIPNSLRTIEEGVFNSCSALKSIIIPESVTSIGSAAFSGCSSLTSMEIPISVTTIGSNAFHNCTNLTSIELPQTITIINNGLFSGCSRLANVQLPNTITSIGAYAFDGCSSLAGIVIPDSVTSIGDKAFASCSSLKSISIPGRVVSIGASAFQNCGELTSILLSEGLKTIGDKAFTSCVKMTNITLPESLNTIGEKAFSSCFELTGITIPENVTKVSEGAFSYCHALESFSGKFVSSDGKSIVVENVLIALITKGASSSYRIPDGIERIGIEITASCDLIVPASVTSIGRDFVVKKDCNLTMLPMVPPSVDVYFTLLGSSRIFVPEEAISAYKSAAGWSDYADRIFAIEAPSVSFSDPTVKGICVSNWDTNQDGELSESEMAAVTSLGDAFKNNTSITSFDELRYFTGLTALYDSFSRCSNLTSITLPESIKTISGAFYHCSSLKTVSLPSGLQSIGGYSFVSCTSLKSITIPASVTSIGSNEFASCTALEQVTLLPTTPPVFGDSCFFDTTCVIYVPKGTLEAYKAAGMNKIPIGRLVEMP